MRVIVVGAGSFGSWCAWNLLNSGVDVTLIDAWGPGNSRASSGGETRVIRTVYGADDFYIEMSKRSMDLWSAFQSNLNEPLMEFTGSLWLCGDDDSYVESSRKKIESLGMRLENFSVEESTKLWPGIDFTDIAKVIFEPCAGFLRARRSCDAVKRDFEKRGGQYLQATVGSIDETKRTNSVRLSTGTTITADQIVFACGPWLKQLFPETIGRYLNISRQEVYYFGTPENDNHFTQERLPVWLELSTPIFYGIPEVDYRGFKIAIDQRGEEFNPSVDDRTPTEPFVELTRSYLQKRFPALAQAPLLESRVCQYTNTPSGHFLMDRHPETGNWILGGGCGHGFKMGPAMGEILAEAILRDKPVPNPFRFEHLTSQVNKTTQFDHA